MYELNFFIQSSTVEIQKSKKIIKAIRNFITYIPKKKSPMIFRWHNELIPVLFVMPS